MAQGALTAQAEIARLKFQLARHRRAELGRSSEKLAREAEQLELALKALEANQAAGDRLADCRRRRRDRCRGAEAGAPPAAAKNLPREDLRHPAPCTCP